MQLQNRYQKSTPFPPERDKIAILSIVMIDAEKATDELFSQSSTTS